ncbi:hypothetical protein PVIIG_05713 [Plasmodium vivax India VII]|uniref:Uncharacterized protein n=1 Tax=Plasmodium vivax India VII TaxID=1077284 RepID=A0A0J9S1T3_PLAVI|nr:hypothetical protein PVIIG_05713 [Plasmodium vivax India VII]
MILPDKKDEWKAYELRNKKVYNYYCNSCERFMKICKPDAHNMCKKIRKNLKQIYAISPGKERIKHCLYYKFWFYEKLMNMFNSDKNSECFNRIITEFKNFKAYSFYGYIDFTCQYDLYGIDMNKLKLHVEKKYLHDYFNNYDMIDNAIRSCNTLYNDIYKEYLNSIVKLYIKYKSGECSSEDHNYILNNCENYFDSHEYYNPQNLLSIVEKCIAGKKIPEKINKEKYLELENSSPKINLKCSEGTYWIDNKFERSMICTDKQEGDIVSNGLNKSPSFSYYQIIFNGVFTLIGVFFLLFLFYKVKILS